MLQTYNLGTGKGYSVLEMVAAFEKASGVKVALYCVVQVDGSYFQLLSFFQVIICFAMVFLTYMYEIVLSSSAILPGALKALILRYRC